MIAKYCTCVTEAPVTDCTLTLLLSVPLREPTVYCFLQPCIQLRCAVSRQTEHTTELHKRGCCRRSSSWSCCCRRRSSRCRSWCSRWAAVETCSDACTPAIQPVRASVAGAVGCCKLCFVCCCAAAVPQEGSLIFEVVVRACCQSVEACQALAATRA
jgi:hypothetical protein